MEKSVGQLGAQTRSGSSTVVGTGVTGRIEASFPRRDPGSGESEYATATHTLAGLSAASNERLHIGFRVTNHVEVVSLCSQSASEVSKDS